MIRNLKSEIIYHMVPTDFEFEFNLCGCCQMRLLTSCSESEKTLVEYLARGVSRSKVIIIIASLSDNKSPLETVANAIGYKTVDLDSTVYSTTHNIKILQNSVPLITKSGEFGGMIAECGSQSLIILSNEKRIQKEILNTLIGPYLADLSKVSHPLTETVNYTAEQISTPKLSKQTEDNNNDTVAETESTNSQSHPDTLPPESEKIDKTFTRNDSNDNFDYSLPSTEKETDEPEDLFRDDFTPPKKAKRSNSSKILTVIICIIMLCLLAFVLYELVYIPVSSGQDISKNFEEVFSSFFKNP